MRTSHWQTSGRALVMIGLDYLDEVEAQLEEYGH
ncbi:MAG: hypothetical protein J07HQW2_00500 [Haloquadratum walsbyi J07HQW2]|uniref:Uncharacterized protein n=1 Tax=Haloquadratum walsbyi J07HQW2 TaxID=1238425 RepID=U1PP44_9EURY|nr:MAG: hypothetical protein J07HQW2_00500 [Haloquadratum walsbyi J07HQW2]